MNGRSGITGGRTGVVTSTNNCGRWVEPLESRQFLSATAVPLAVANVRPVITTLVAAPSPVTRGTPLALVAGGVADPDGTGVAKVEFYRDANGNGLFEKSIDPQIGLDGSPRRGWSIVLDTSAFPAGTNTFFARTRDKAGEVSKPAVVAVAVQVPGTKPTYVGDYIGEIRFSDGFVDVIDLSVTGNPRGYITGDFSQRTAGYAFTFTGTFLKNNGVSFVYGGDGSGTGTGTVSTDRNTINGTFNSLVDGRRYSGTFRVTKV